MTTGVFMLLAATLLQVKQSGVELTVSADGKAVDPARPLVLTVALKTDPGVEVAQGEPDLSSRLRGFAARGEPIATVETGQGGATEATYEWLLVPDPCSEVYKIAPFAVSVSSRDGKSSFWAGPVYFDPPPARPPVAGAMEVDPERALPPFSWKLLGLSALALAGALVACAGVFLLVRHIVRRVREYRMSPIERAWVELDRLLKKGLPGRGRFKDFYVELTMVVRRYVQRKYGVRAPHLTTEEFFAELDLSGQATAAQARNLREFLTSADMVKFAGVQATPEMADEATQSARDYLRGDSAATAGKGGKAS